MRILQTNKNASRFPQNWLDFLKLTALVMI